MYLQGMAQQTQVFLLSIGFGFCLGLLYDAVRFLRKCISRKRAAVFAQDVLFFSVSTVLVFFFLLCVNNGILRAYPFLAMPLGFAVYYFTLGTLLGPFSSRAGAVIFRFLRFVPRKIKKGLRAVKKLRKKREKNTK